MLGVLARVAMIPVATVAGAFAGAAVAVLAAVSAFRKTRSRSVNLANQVVVITGAAGGFGRILVAACLGKGAVVYAIDVAPAEAMRSALGDHPNLCVISVDVTDNAALKRAVDRIATEQSSIFALINNAGCFGCPCAAVEGSPAEVRKVLDVNFFAATELTRLCFPHMRQHHAPGIAEDGRPLRSRIVNITSVAGLVAGRGMAAYSASKFALEAWSDSTRMELANRLDVAIVEPFFARTNIVTGLLNVPDEQLRESIIGDQLLQAKERSKNWASGKEPIMTPEFVCERIMQAATEERPRDRYFVAPNPVVGLILRSLYLLPNYFGLVDRLKAAA